MLSLLAHAGAPPAPHDLPTAWNLDPTLLLGLALLWWVHRRGRTRPATSESRRRHRLFDAGLVVVAIALVSPLDAASSALASAHMVQHVLLVLVAAPLLAASGPGPALARGLPRWLVVRSTRVGHRVGATPSRLRAARHPVPVVLLHVVVLWTWHASAAYQAALDVPLLHVAEHALFLGSGVVVWQLVVGPRAWRVPDGVGVVVLFVLALQGVFLAALLTFANEAWYPGYATTTAAFGLTPLADQQLAGVVMWVPGGLVHTGLGVLTFVRWLRASESATAGHV